MEQTIDLTTEPPKNYRINAKNIFYTWPQCDELKEVVRGKLTIKFHNKDINFIIVAQEQHKDGTNHLHAVTSCSRYYTSVNPNWADDIAGKHGNYASCRNLRDAVNYVTKDGNYCVHPADFDLQKWLKESTPMGRKRKVTDEIADLLIQGETLKKVMYSHPGFTLIHLRNIQDFEAVLLKNRKEDKEKSSKEPWQLLEKKPSWTSAEESMANWLNRNLFQKKRPLGTLQLYVYGPTGVGKTHLIRNLTNYCRIYFVPMDEDWYDEFDNHYDLCVLDEFRGQKQFNG